jgi:hypothetical protein
MLLSALCIRRGEILVFGFERTLISFESFEQYHS